MGMNDPIINFGRSTSSELLNKNDFLVRWSFKVPYRNSRTTWMVGRGSKATGASFDLYQDSNNNRRFDRQDAFTGFGKIPKNSFSDFNQILKGGRGKILGYSDFTADIIFGNRTIGEINWF